MKNTFLYISLFFVFSSLKAQVNANFTLDWKTSLLYSSENTTHNIPQFQLNNFYFDDVKKAIFFVANIPSTTTLNEQSVVISNVVYENIESSKLGDLNLNNIPAFFNLKIANLKSRDDLSFSISLSPIIKEGQFFKRIKSFTISAKSGGNQVMTQNRALNAVSNSVLATGDWFRFYVEKSGIYQMTRGFLQQLGLNTANIDPRNIKIYGNGGRMVPLKNIDPYPSDLEENAVKFVGESDGVFDNQDYILFYAEGLDKWSEENASHNNLYDSKSYYYVTIQGQQGKRISAMPNLGTVSATPITTFDDYQYYEKDLVNVARLGRKWFGEQISVVNELPITFKVPNFVAGSTANITVAGVAVAFANTKLEIKINTNPVENLNFSFLTPFSGLEGSENTSSYSLAATENIDIKLKYNNSNIPGSKCFLDYIILQSKRNLVGINKQFPFQYNLAATTSGVGNFQISNATNISEVWDVTDIYNVANVVNTSQNLFSFKANLGEVRKYIALDNSDFYQPKKDAQSRVANQNLKGTIFKNSQNQFQDIDYLIVTPVFLKNSADKLANFHRQYSNYNVKVVTLDQIYQEFSSGKQDIGAIRNLVKYIYNNASTPAKKIKYLNLFGDASFDFKNRIPNNTNIVPIYHSINSFSLSSSYISDDFFVLLDDNEGDMNSQTNNGLDVAVGRILASSVAQAEQMVNKIIEYHDAKSYGRWRNNFVLVSDDVDVSGEETLQSGLDNLGNQIFAQKPFVNLKKIHSDAYIQETSSGGNRYPKVREDFINAFNQGCLVINYFGHGGEDGLAKERIWEKSDGQNLSNQFKYPLFVTITCEFTRFDNPFRPTAGEFIYWNPKGGAISMVTTTRQIGIGTGQLINEAFSANLYGFGTNDLTSIAEALRKSKSQYSSNALMVFYIGDPALQLAIPKPKIVLTKLNDVPISQPVDALKSLSNIKLSGEIRDENGNNLLSNYNGELAVNIFDKNIERKTLGNDGTRDGLNQLYIMTFNTLGETIFRGNASIKNGLFEFNFVVPRDIRIPLGNGRISFYAKKNAQLLDQTGFDASILVGGINNNAPADNISPTVKLYMNDISFVNGGITNQSPILLAFLEDENGINTASGIGHDIIGILDGDETKPFIMNDFYETELDNFKKGTLKFPFKNLAIGLHTLTFKAWDVYNNPIQMDIQFVVVGNETLTLTNVLNYPNPFVNYTEFWFTHNRPFEPLDVQVQVMTVTGKIVWTKNQVITTNGFLSREITWDGKDDFGDKIGKGVYVYKLTVRSTVSNNRTEKFEKLVIL